MFAHTGPGSAPGPVTVRLSFRPPLVPDSLFGHLAATAVPGVEEWRAGAYRRTLRLPAGVGIVELRPEPDHIACCLLLTDQRDLPVAVARCRRLLDLDADPATVATSLSADPILRPLVRRAPGRRVPGTVDGAEMAIRAVLGQQVSTKAARTHAARLVTAIGQPVHDPEGTLTHLFPTSPAIADIDPVHLRLPERRSSTLRALARSLATGTLDLSVGADRARAMTDLDGIGPWTAGTIAMRALGDPDVFLSGDLGVRAAAGAIGLPTSQRALDAHALRWRPWRSYAVQYLWAAIDHEINRLPANEGP